MRYESPKSTREAVALMAAAKGNAYLLAGGTDLLVRIRAISGLPVSFQIRYWPVQRIPLNRNFSCIFYDLS